MQGPENENDSAGATRGADQTNIIPFPVMDLSAEIAEGVAACNLLLRNIAELRRNLGVLEVFVATIEDSGQRQKVQNQSKSLDELLLQRSDQLTDVERLLHDTLRRTVHPDPPEVGAT
ncbi:hypothetical protein ACVWXO_006789 [Bradyrhizobium sp. LM2.7]